MKPKNLAPFSVRAAWKPARIAGLLLSLFLPLAIRLPAAQQTLYGHVPAAIAGLQPLGRLPGTSQFHLSLELPIPNRPALVTLVGQMYDPASTNFHRYLTPDQFAAQFGPAQRDYDALKAFASANHLTVESTFKNRALLAVTGSAADIEAAFHIHLMRYRHPTENREFYAPDTEPTVDASLPAMKINGLDNYFLPRPAAHFTPAPTRTSGASSGAGSGPGGEFLGYDYRNAYAPGVSLDGSGQTVAVFELDGFYPNDITTYENYGGLPHLSPTVVLVGSFNGVPSTNFNAVGECSLDIESEIAMAPGMASLLVYEGNNTPSILYQIAQDDLAKQVSSSWFFGDASTNDTELLQMASQGQTFFQCSGDNLAYTNGVHYGPNSGPPADDPYLVSVGGTELTTTSGKSWLSESNWNNANGVNGSGGGTSGIYGIPLWQKGVNMSGNGGSTSGRNIPDVSMVADYCFFVSNNGNSNGFWWGTSIAAPLWAGFAALVNEQAVGEGKPTVGFLNPAIYAIGEGPYYNTCFHDITVGNNTWSASPARYYATSGYDLCTGWGTPTGINLINALAGYGGPVFVDFNFSGIFQFGTYLLPYSTLARGVAGVANKGTIFIERAGSSSETMTISKPMTITAENGAATVGN